MAEFLNQKKPEKCDGFDAIGKPIPMYRRQTAYDDCKSMGLTSNDNITACVGGMAEALERDKPYEAMEIGMKYLDLTGTYRLMAVLLTTPKPDYKKYGSMYENCHEESQEYNS